MSKARFRVSRIIHGERPPVFSPMSLSEYCDDWLLKQPDARARLRTDWELSPRSRVGLVWSRGSVRVFGLALGLMVQCLSSKNHPAYAGRSSIVCRLVEFAIDNPGCFRRSEKNSRPLRLAQCITPTAACLRRRACRRREAGRAAGVRRHSGRFGRAAICRCSAAVTNR